VWEQIQQFRSLSDQVVKQGSLAEGSANLSDTLLLQVNETAVLFFEELQSHWLPNSEAG
jgi:hypothetical protein